ncbi:hypothetical protein [Streptomyces malaysiensis]|uniref:hypothetical protein n=1 Tax=Streptomyces malaysiensis TaxID=92644 RepID=UPI0013567127|nr:hypothetical protein [Streptomyces sp. SPMA113]
MADVRSTEDELGLSLPAGLATLLMVCDGTVDASAHDRDPDEYDLVCSSPSTAATA